MRRCHPEPSRASADAGEELAFVVAFSVVVAFVFSFAAALIFAFAFALVVAFFFAFAFRCHPDRAKRRGISLRFALHHYPQLHLDSRTTI